MKHQLQSGSHFGFIGLEMMFDNHLNYPRIGLHSCHGLFWGCIPDDAPALLMHTGHKRTHLAWIQHRMLAALQRWISLQEQHITSDDGGVSEMAPAAAGAADGRWDSGSSSSGYFRAAGVETAGLQQQPAEQAAAAAGDDYKDGGSYIVSNGDELHDEYTQLDDGNDDDLVPLAAGDYNAGADGSSSSSREGTFAAESSKTADSAAEGGYEAVTA
jgi:hypothetical protein